MVRDRRLRVRAPSGVLKDVATSGAVHHVLVGATEREVNEIHRVHGGAIEVSWSPPSGTDTRLAAVSAYGDSIAALDVRGREVWLFEEGIGAPVSLRRWSYDQPGDAPVDPSPTGAHRVPQCAAGLADVGLEDIETLPTDRLISGHARDLFRCPIERGDVPVAVYREHTVTDRIENDVSVVFP